MSIGRSPRAWRRRASIGLTSSLPVEGNIDRDFVEQPLRGAGRGQHGQRAVDDGGVERGVGGIADERGDEGHAGEFAKM